MTLADTRSIPNPPFQRIGTGFYYALAAANKGATVVMLNRASERATSAAVSLRERCTGTGTFDDSITCDLMSFKSVRRAAEAVLSKYSTGIDVLCNNAGIMAFPDAATEDGFDTQMQTNHLSHFLLTTLLFSLLEKAADVKGEARIVNHSSIARHGHGTLKEQYFGPNGGNLGGDGSSMFCGGARWVRYGMTKLANSVFTYMLDKKLKAKGSKVKAVVAAPGLSHTNLQLETEKRGGMASGCGGNMWIMSMAQSSGDGAMGILHASFKECEGGLFYEPKNGFSGLPVLVKPKAYETDVTSSEMMWAASEKAVGATFLTEGGAAVATV
mgnify:CR=1 FL=1